MGNIRTKAMEQLFRAILNLETEEECGDFLEDLMTIRELQDISQRFEVAVLLSQGKNYQEVAQEVRVSSATISRVNKCLQYGSGGYQRALEKLRTAGEEV